jgi:uncharacterized protein (DUF58 family)
MKEIHEYIAGLHKNLKFTANAIVEGFIAGLHQSPYHGFSVEFSDHKAYSDGDSVGLIDWKLYSKTDRYYIKRYEEETNVRAYFLLDCSASMGFHSGDIKKIDYAKLLTACLINLSLNQRDATSLTLFNENIISTIPAKSRSTWLNQCLTMLTQARCSGYTNISNTIFTIGQKVGKRSLFVIITDALDDTDKLKEAMNYLKFQQHHCILFHILDPKEETLSYQNESEFVDIETEEVIKIAPWMIKKEYMEKVKMFLVKHQEMMLKLKFEYAQITTTSPLVQALKLYLINRNYRNR